MLNSLKFNSRKVDLGKFQSTVIGVIASWSLSFNGKIIHCSSEVKLRITIGNHLKFGNHIEYFSKRVSFKIGIWQLKRQGLLLMHSLITSLVVLYSCRCLLLKQQNLQIHTSGSLQQMWCVARFGTIYTIFKRWKASMEQCYF